MKKVLLAIVLVLLCSAAAKGFFPDNCNTEHAAKDYSDSDAVLIGRVIKVERTVETDPGVKGRIISTYTATLKIGRVERSIFQLKADDEIKLFAGMTAQSREDNAEPTFLHQCNTHGPPGYVFDGVYVLFLTGHTNGKFKGGEIIDPLKLDWASRSCHFSTHLVTQKYDEKTDTRFSVVKSGNVEMKVDDFIKMKKEQSEKAAKEAKEKGK